MLRNLGPQFESAVIKLVIGQHLNHPFFLLLFRRSLKFALPFCLVFLLLILYPPRPVLVSSSAANVIAITRATLTDGSGRPPVKDSVVIIKGDRVDFVGRVGQVSIPTSAQVIDARGLIIAPGFIDTTHIRDEADLTFEALAEAIRIGREGHVPVQIFHIKLGSVAVWGRANEAVALIKRAQRRGQDITADCYPYDAWSSTIRVLIPSGRHDNSADVARGIADVGGAANITIVARLIPTTNSRHWKR